MIRASKGSSSASGSSGPSPEQGRQLWVDSPATAAHPSEKSSQKAPRIVPCSACQAIRRSCEWIVGQRACARCSRLGKAEACSGPSKRARQVLDSYRRGAQPTALLSIAPSSPTSQMAATQLSYSLTYHLVETFYQMTPGVAFLGVDDTHFKERFRQTGGRSSALGADDELLAVVYMLYGAQLSNHSAIVGASSSAPAPIFGSFRISSDMPDTQAIGFARRPAMDSIRFLLGRQLENLSFDDSTRPVQDLANLLAITWMGLCFITQDLEVERHRALGVIIQQGLKLLQRSDCAGEVRARLSMYLQGLSREELRSSYSNDFISAISPTMHKQIFGVPTVLQLLTPISDRELQLVFSISPADRAELIAMFDTQIFAIESHLDHLARLLVYTPLTSLSASVRQCWDGYDALSLYLGATIRTTLQDDRYMALTLEQQGRRPMGLITHNWTEEMMACLLLCGCHRALQRKGGEEEMLQESEARLLGSLTRMAENTELILNLPMPPISTFISTSRVCTTVEHYRGPILDRWVRENPLQAEQLLRGLRFAAFGLPDAARLVMEMEELLAQTNGTTETAERIVEGVVKQLGEGEGGEDGREVSE